MILRCHWRGLAVVLTVLALGASACSTSPGSTPSATTASTGVSLSKDIQPILNANCVICHQGTAGPMGLNMQVGSAYKNLVNVKSAESPLMRVAPGTPDKSYIVNKLLGTQGQIDGSGAQMPYGAPPLSQSQIDLIRQWITQGAPNN